MLAEMLLRWKTQSKFQSEDDWVFASWRSRGQKPLRPTSVLENFIKPAAQTASLGLIGWHTFRHSYRAWLDDTNAPILVQRDLMRHASIQMTADYGKRTKVSDQKREVHSRVVKMILPKEENCA